MGIFQNIRLMLELLKVPFFDIRDNIIHNINICADDSSFYSKFEQVFDLW